MQLEEALLEDLPGFEPELEEEDDDERAQGQQLMPSLPAGLPPGRYYMDVPANAPPGYAPDWKFHQGQPPPGRGQPSLSQPPQRQPPPSRQSRHGSPPQAQQWPAEPPVEWREQFRARMMSGYPGGAGQHPASLM